MYRKCDPHSRNMYIFRIYLKLGFYIRRILHGLLICFMWLWETCSLSHFSSLFLWMDALRRILLILYEYVRILYMKHVRAEITPCHITSYQTYMEYMYMCVCVHIFHTHASLKTVKVLTTSAVFQLLIVLPNFNQSRWNLSCQVFALGW